MAKTIYIRTPESNHRVQDNDLKVVGSLAIPTINGDNEDEQIANGIGFVDGVLSSYDGTVWSPVGVASAPETLTINGETIINWQTDIIPSGTQTYFERFGNNPPKPYAYGPDWFNTNGFSVLVTWSSPGVIDTVTFNADLTPTTLYL